LRALIISKSKLLVLLLVLILLFLHDHNSSFHTRGIEAAMREWTSKTGGCITFQRRSTERNYLQFFVGNGCWGHIGKPNGRSQISVGRGCEKQNVMAHEIGHVLGFW